MKRAPFKPLNLAVLGALALAIFWAAVDRPLAARLAAQEAPLDSLRRQLAAAAGEAGLPPGAAPAEIQAKLAALQEARAELAAAAAAARARLAPPAGLAQRLEEPFQLVEFQNELQRRLEDIGRTAGEARVVLEAAVAGGFPKYVPDFAEPGLHWAQLELVTRLLRAAIAAGVGTVHQVAVPPAPARPLNGSAAWSEIRASMVFTGPAEAALQVVAGLTLLPEEAAAAGLPAGVAGRPALLLDHLLLRRTALERPDELRAELVVSLVVPAGEEAP